MANSNYSVANKLLAYIAHGVDLTPEIKQNYVNSLIFIGDEGQIYSPINNTYIGIGQTSYTNLLAYTNFLSAEIDMLTTMLTTSLVSKVYGQYDNYDKIYSKLLKDGDTSFFENDVLTKSQYERYVNLHVGEDNMQYGTQEITLRGAGDYDPNTGLAYTTIDIIKEVKPVFFSDYSEYEAQAEKYLKQGNLTKDEFENAYKDAQTALASVENGTTTLTAVGELYKEILKVVPVTGLTQNVLKVNNAFGSSGITVTLKHGDAVKTVDNAGNPYYTYSRNIFEIDDSLTWSYIANAYTYSMDFAKTWATSEANRIYHNLIGSYEKVYTPITYNVVAEFAQTQSGSTVIAGYYYNSVFYAEPSKFTYGEVYNYKITNLYYRLYCPTATTSFDSLDPEYTDLSVDQKLYFDEHNYPYIIANWESTNGNPVKTYKELEDRIKDLNPKFELTNYNSFDENTEVIYYIADTQYESTYNMNIADGIQTLKEVAYLLDILTDGFGSVTYYKAFDPTALFTADTDLNAAVKNNNEATYNLLTGVSDNDFVVNSDTEFTGTKGEKVLDLYRYKHLYQTRAQDSDVLAPSEIVKVLANFYKKDDIYTAATVGEPTDRQLSVDSTYTLEYCTVYAKRSDIHEYNTTSYINKTGADNYSYTDVDMIKFADLHPIESTSYLDFSANIEYYTYNTETGIYTKVENYGHTYLTDNVNNLYVINTSKANVSEEHYYILIVKPYEVTDTENLGIKMAYTIAGNQEQINTLDNRITSVENGENVLRSIDTTSSTYITLSTVSNQPELIIYDEENKYTYSVGDTNIKVGLHFGTTYNTAWRENVTFVNTAYMNIACIGGSGSEREYNEDDDTIYLYKFTEIDDKENINLNDKLNYYVVKDSIGYRYATTLDTINDEIIIYCAESATGGEIYKKHTDAGELGFIDWADDSTSYYGITTRGEEETETIHVDLNSHGLTYTSWVTSYVADTYTLVTNAMRTMEADIINSSKSMLDGLDYSYAASSSQFISYTYEWNGMLGAAARELPSDEIYTNVEVWGENTSTQHIHTFTAITDPNKEILVDTTYTYNYTVMDWDPDTMFEYTTGLTSEEIKNHTSKRYVESPKTGNRQKDSKDEEYNSADDKETADEIKKIIIANGNHGFGAYWPSEHTAIREYRMIDVNIQLYREVSTDIDGSDARDYELVKLPADWYNDNWFACAAEKYGNNVIHCEGDDTLGLWYSHDGGITAHSALFDFGNLPLIMQKGSLDFDATNEAVKATETAQGSGMYEWAHEQHPRTENNILGTPEGYKQWRNEEGNTDSKYGRFNTWPATAESNTEKEDKNKSWIVNGVAHTDAEEFVQLYFKVKRYVEVAPQDVMIAEVTNGAMGDSQPDYGVKYTSENNITKVSIITDVQMIPTSYVDSIDNGKATFIADCPLSGQNWYLVADDNVASVPGSSYMGKTFESTYVLYKTSDVVLYKKCEADSAVEQVKYIDSRYEHITAEFGGYGENRMHVTTYITHLEDASETNSGLVDAYDARTFIDNMFEWVDLSASVSTSLVNKNIEDNKEGLDSRTTFNVMNPNLTTYTSANMIKISYIPLK